MKKLLLIVLSITTLIGCNDDSESNETNKTSNETNNVSYDIELRTNESENKFVDWYSYNEYDTGGLFWDLPAVTRYDNRYLLEGILLEIRPNGLQTPLIAELRLELGTNISNDQVINIYSDNPSGDIILGFGVGGGGYFFEQTNSVGQVKITNNSNNRLSGEFTFNNLKKTSENTPFTYNNKISGKFNNIPIVN